MSRKRSGLDRTTRVPGCHATNSKELHLLKEYQRVYVGKERLRINTDAIWLENRALRDRLHLRDRCEAETAQTPVSKKYNNDNVIKEPSRSNFEL